MTQKLKLELELPELPQWGMSLAETVGTVEKHFISEALRVARGNKTLAASYLDLKRTTLCQKMVRYGYLMNPPVRKGDKVQKWVSVKLIEPVVETPASVETVAGLSS